MARREHARHPSRQVYRSEERAQQAEGGRRGSIREGIFGIRLRQAQQQDKRNGQPLTRRGQDDDYRCEKPCHNSQVGRGVGQRDASEGIQQQGRMGSLGSVEHAAFRLCHHQPYRKDNDRRFRWHRGRYIPAFHRRLQDIQPDGKL